MFNSSFYSSFKAEFFNAKLHFININFDHQKFKKDKADLKKKNIAIIFLDVFLFFNEIEKKKYINLKVIFIALFKRLLLSNFSYKIKIVLAF